MFFLKAQAAFTVLAAKDAASYVRFKTIIRDDIGKVDGYGTTSCSCCLKIMRERRPDHSFVRMVYGKVVHKCRFAPRIPDWP